jgi:hypothetical protein
MHQAIERNNNPYLFKTTIFTQGVSCRQKTAKLLQNHHSAPRCVTKRRTYVAYNQLEIFTNAKVGLTRFIPQMPSRRKPHTAVKIPTDDLWSSPLTSRRQRATEARAVTQHRLAWRSFGGGIVETARDGNVVGKRRGMERLRERGGSIIEKH